MVKEQYCVTNDHSSYNPCFSSFDKRRTIFHDKMVTRAYLVQPETVSTPLHFQTKRIHLDQLCWTKTKLCGVTHHTGLFLLPCTYTQPPNTELPTGFLLQQPLKQKEGYSSRWPSSFASTLPSFIKASQHKSERDYHHAGLFLVYSQPGSTQKVPS